MTDPNIIDLDDYERRKLALLTFEKFNALFISFMLVVSVLFAIIVVCGVVYDVYWIATTHPANAGRLIRANIFLLAQLVLLFVVLCGGIYFARASAQSRPRSIRLIRIMALPLVAAFVYLIYATPPLQDFLLLLLRTYLVHWTSIVEFTLALVLSSLAQFAYLRGSRTMRRETERDKVFLREDSDMNFLRGRVLGTALGIPRIVDLMPHRRWLASAAFVLANFFFALSIGWIAVYIGFVGWRWIVFLEYHGGSLADPYLRETAVSHMVSSLSASLFAYAVPPYIGGFILSFARRNVRWSITELLRVDRRSPILFLRAFADDQVKLGDVRLSLLGRTGRWLEVFANLDRMLLEEGTPYGPVVAIGNPADPLPPYGAAREFFTDETWQSAVAKLARDAQVIVVCLDRTPGIWWEVGHIAELGYLPKTLFLVHPKYASDPGNAALAADVARELRLADGFPHLPAAASGAARAPGLLGFFVDPNGRLQIGCSTTFSRLAFVIMVRWFLRTKLGFAGTVT